MPRGDTGLRVWKSWLCILTLSGFLTASRVSSQLYLSMLKTLNILTLLIKGKNKALKKS